MSSGPSPLTTEVRREQTASRLCEAELVSRDEDDGEDDIAPTCLATSADREALEQASVLTRSEECQRSVLVMKSRRQAASELLSVGLLNTQLAIPELNDLHSSTEQHTLA